MLGFKKTALAFLVCNSSTVFAGAMGTVCAPGNVTLPCQHQGWEVGGKALYLQSTWGALNFPYYQINNKINEFHNESPAWDWGFMLEGSYHFATGNDVNLNWYHVNDSHSNTIGNSFYLADSNTRPTYYGPARFTNKSTWDAVNVEFGQQVDYNQAVSIRYHAGFEYAHIDFKHMITTFPPAPFLATSKGTISYNGFGPRAGLDATYSFENGLSVYAKSAIGLYAGSSKFDLMVVPYHVGQSGSSMIVVPELEAKTGVTYTYSMAYGDISLDGGWLWLNYFNPMTHADDNELHSVNFGLQGPYLGLKWVGNLA